MCISRSSDYIQRFSGKMCLGDARDLSPIVSVARVFGSSAENGCVNVALAGRSSSKALITFTFQVNYVSDADDRSTPILDPRLPIPDSIAYVIDDASSTYPKLKANTPTMRLYHNGKNPPVQKWHSSPLVLTSLAKVTPSSATPIRNLSAQKMAGELLLTVRVCNLSEGSIKFPAESFIAGRGSKKANLVSVSKTRHFEIAWKPDTMLQLEAR